MYMVYGINIQVHVHVCSLFVTGGRVAVYGDSNCIDSAHLQSG